jgi:hypothetical protein
MNKRMHYIRSLWATSAIARVLASKALVLLPR